MLVDLHEAVRDVQIEVPEAAEAKHVHEEGAQERQEVQDLGLYRFQRPRAPCAVPRAVELVQVRFAREEVRRSVFRKAFPDRMHFRILIDSERLLHMDEAKRAFADYGITPMPGWPKYSPDLNPQENVWSWAEKALRKKEQKSDTFTIFCRKLLRVARRYPSAASLIPSMAKRVQAVLKHGGAMTKY